MRPWTLAMSVVAAFYAVPLLATLGFAALFGVPACWGLVLGGLVGIACLTVVMGAAAKAAGA